MPTYDEALEAYVRDLFAREGETLARIRERTVAAGHPQIMIRPEEGRFLQFLAAVSGAKYALEIGTLGGYSGGWILSGLAPDGWLVTVERDAGRARVAEENFQGAGLGDRAKVRVGDAHELLPGLTEEGPFDFIFIDAEKEGYEDYLAWSMENLRPGGILAAHNALAHGAVANPHDRQERTQALRAFNQKLAADERFISLIFPAGDGIAFGWMKP